MPTKSSTTKRKRIKFAIEGDKKSSVYLTGSFNGWNPSQKKLKYKDGVFSTSILLSKGRHEYKFIIDGTWCIDPDCTEWAPNKLGSLNSVIDV